MNPGPRSKSPPSSPKSLRSNTSLCGKWLKEAQESCISDSDSDDDASMFVNTPSLFEMAIKRFPEVTRIHSTRSQPSDCIYKTDHTTRNKSEHISRKHDFLKKFWTKKQRKVERHISTPTHINEGNVKVVPINGKNLQNFSRMMSFSMSQFDVNSIERRIEIGESGKTHSIGEEFA